MYAGSCMRAAYGTHLLSRGPAQGEWLRVHMHVHICGLPGRSRVHRRPRKGCMHTHEHAWVSHAWVACALGCGSAHDELTAIGFGKRHAFLENTSGCSRPLPHHLLALAQIAVAKLGLVLAARHPAACNPGAPAPRRNRPQTHYELCERIKLRAGRRAGSTAVGR